MSIFGVTRVFAIELVLRVRVSCHKDLLLCHAGNHPRCLAKQPLTGLEQLAIKGRESLFPSMKSF